MPLNSILDSAITRRLARYLEMSDASSGFSDVVVKDGHITVHHAFAKLEPANELLAEKGVPAVVRLCYLKKLDVHVPWGHLSSGAPRWNGCAAEWWRWRRSCRGRARLPRGMCDVLRASCEYERGLMPRRRPVTPG